MAGIGRGNSYFVRGNQAIGRREIRQTPHKTSSKEEVSIDLWSGYKNLVKELMPNAEIVADRFHVMTAGDAFGVMRISNRRVEISK